MKKQAGGTVLVMLGVGALAWWWLKGGKAATPCESGVQEWDKKTQSWKCRPTEQQFQEGLEEKY